MSGMDRNTGKSLDGWAHVQQSIGVILTTPKMARVMRRAFGAGLQRRVDSPISQVTIIDFYSEVAKAIRAYEPRFRPARMSVNSLAAGQISMNVAGTYYPRGHLGDFSISIPQNATVAL